MSHRTGRCSQGRNAEGEGWHRGSVWMEEASWLAPPNELEGEVNVRER